MTIAEIINFIKNYRVNTHAIGAFVLALPLFYQQNVQFHDAVNAAWLHVPNGLRGLIVAAGPLWMLYRNSMKAASVAPPITVNTGVTIANPAVVQKAGHKPLSGFGEKK